MIGLSSKVDERCFRAAHTTRWPLAYGLYTILAAAMPSGLFGQAPIRISDGSMCSTCRVVLDSIATIAGSDSVSFTWQTEIVVANDQYFVGPTYTPGQIAVFDRNGRLAGTFGRRGAGPGEFQSDHVRIRPGPGDSIHVLDRNRWMVFSSPQFEFNRFVRITAEPTSFAIIDSGANKGDLLASYPTRVATGHMFTVHLISAKSGDVIRSFDAPETADLRDEWDSFRSVTWYDERVWSLTRNRIKIRSETLGGDTVTQWVRTDGWFPAVSESNTLEPFIARPAAKAWSVRPTAQAIWLYATVADSEWKPLATSEQDPRLRAWRTVDMNGVYDGMVEVIDRATGNVITQLRSDLILVPVEGSSSLVFRKRMNTDGELTIDVLRLSIRR